MLLTLSYSETQVSALSSEISVPAVSGGIDAKRLGIGLLTVVVTVQDCLLNRPERSQLSLATPQPYCSQQLKKQTPVSRTIQTHRVVVVTRSLTGRPPGTKASFESAASRDHDAPSRCSFSVRRQICTIGTAFSKRTRQTILSAHDGKGPTTQMHRLQWPRTCRKADMSWTTLRFYSPRQFTWDGSAEASEKHLF